MQQHVLSLNSEHSENISLKKSISETEQEADLSTLSKKRDRKSYF